jgi:hypothetical protein
MINRIVPLSCWRWPLHDQAHRLFCAEPNRNGGMQRLWSGSLKLSGRVCAVRLCQPRCAKGRHTAAVGRPAPSTRSTRCRRRAIWRSGSALMFETLMVSVRRRDFGRLRTAGRSRPLSRRLFLGLLPAARRARWHDGEPVTPEDVVWTFEQTVANNPQREFYYRHVIKAEAPAREKSPSPSMRKTTSNCPRSSANFSSCPNTGGKQEPDGEPAAIGETTLEPPLGSGPYRIANVSPGER